MNASAPCSLTDVRNAAILAGQLEHRVLMAREVAAGLVLGHLLTNVPHERVMWPASAHISIRGTRLDLRTSGLETGEQQGTAAAAAVRGPGSETLHDLPVGIVHRVVPIDPQVVCRGLVHDLRVRLRVDEARARAQKLGLGLVG